MPTPTAYTEWGYLGAVIFLVVAFGVFIIRRDKEWRDFFTVIRSTDSEASKKVTEVLEKLVERVENLENKFDAHDAKEMEFLHGVGRKGQLKRPTGN